MNASDLAFLSAHELSALLRAREISSVEATRAQLAHLRKVEPNVDAFLTVTEDVALAQAAAADSLIAEGRGTPLTGVPYALKDVLMFTKPYFGTPVEPTQTQRIFEECDFAITAIGD